MRYIICRVLRSFLNMNKTTICNYKNFCLPIVQNTSIRTITILNAAAAATTALLEEKEKDSKEVDESEMFFSNDVRAACLKNDEALKDLMNVLSACLSEISKEYQENIGKQIELITQSTHLGPVGEHWDALTKYRVEANELRQELTKYETLVQKVGQMAYNQAVTSLLSGIENAMDLLEVHFSNLEKTVTKLSQENYQWETKLLYANRDSIIHGLKMSTQRGSNSRSRAQKHQNRSAFKNNLHDTSQRTKFINNIHISDVCERCKEIIEWKIKYKKYKPLTQPKKCVRCDGKTVKKAYHVMCTECGRKLGVCTKCCQAKEVIPSAPEQKEEIKLEGELQMLLQSLPERKRRTFIRYINRKSKDTQDSKSKEEIQGEMLQKLNELNVSDKNSSFDFSNSESDLDDDCGEFNT